MIMGLWSGMIHGEPWLFMDRLIPAIPATPNSI